MSAPAMHDALAAWRNAERHWESTAPDDPGYRAASIRVVSAWLSYHEAASSAPGSFVLIVDDDLRYVAVSPSVHDHLGYAPEELVGQRIADVLPPDARANTPTDWQQFLTDGRQDGEYRVLARDGREIHVRFQARAHHPVPGFHLSRMWPKKTADLAAEAHDASSTRSDR